MLDMISPLLGQTAWAAKGSQPRSWSGWLAHFCISGLVALNVNLQKTGRNRNASWVFAKVWKAGLILRLENLSKDLSSWTQINCPDRLLWCSTSKAVIWWYAPLMFLLLAPFVTQDYCLPYYWCIPKTLFCENPYFFKKWSCSISKWHEIKVWCDPKDVQVSNFCETGRILKVEPLKLQRQSLSVMLKSWYTELAKPSFLRPEFNLSLNVDSTP